MSPIGISQRPRPRRDIRALPEMFNRRTAPSRHPRGTGAVRAVIATATSPRPFSMQKFRTMVQDADKLESRLDNNENDGLLFKIREDPRITSIDRVLRRFSIDELPQFITGRDEFA